MGVGRIFLQVVAKIIFQTNSDKIRFTNKVL